MIGSLPDELGSSSLPDELGSMTIPPIIVPYIASEHTVRTKIKHLSLCTFEHLHIMYFSKIVFIPALSSVVQK